MKILPGQLAFYILMSFIPIIAIISVVATILLKNFDIVVELTNYLPDVIADILIPLLINTKPNINVIILIFSYLILASNGASAIITTSDELYKIKRKKVLRVKLKSMLMTIVIVILLLFMLFVPVFGDTIIKAIFRFIGSPNWLYNYVFIYKIIKTIISFLFIYLFMLMLYTIAPNKKIKLKTTRKGALFTTLGWIGATEVFAIYITKFARYNLLYGNFANILILLIWINLLAYLFVIGMAINVNEYLDYKIEI